MESYGVLSILPPVITILLALLTKNVYISLFIGVFLGFGVINDWNLIIAMDQTLNSFVKVFESSSNTIIIIVTLLLGALIYVMEKSGGVAGFVELMIKQKGIIKSKKGANIFTWIMGILVFTSGTLSTLVVGSVTRPINDSLKVPHEKSSFIVHTTSTPVCVLIPLSGWGASMIGYLQSAGLEAQEATQVMLQTIPLNFYCLIAVFSVLFFALTGKDFGPMKKAEKRAEQTGLLDEPKSNSVIEDEFVVGNNVSALSDGKVTSAANLIVPIITLVATIFIVLIITGNGNVTQGNGMNAILWGSFIALLVAGIMYRYQKIFKITEMIEISFKGASGMISIACILMFAFAMGSVVKELGTGQFLADSLKGFLTPSLLPMLAFIMAGIISFSTGTSMGTMAITMVIALPMAMTMGASIPLVASAVFGGSIFGDHSSPISDTTVMTCSTTGCDIIDHVKTQIPYTFTFAAIAAVLYLIVGFMF